MNCSFNIRYKPRTTRAFTKSDLTVYDSEGNTSLNALTVYGKSEVVDNKIVSAGEGYAVVDLGTLTWGYSSSYQTPIFSALLSTIGGVPNSINFICPNYTPKAYFWETSNNDMCIASSGSYLIISNFNYTDPTAFKTAMSGILLCYELADPTQGNTIAVKTDNGTGINGTMAVFSTGTPLYGVSDTVRDVMEWDGSVGTVTKKVAKVNSNDLTWYWNSTDNAWQTNTLQNSIKAPLSNNIVPPPYITPNNYTIVAWSSASWNDKTTSVNMAGTLMIKDSNYDSNMQPDFDIIYELATPTTQSLTSTENASIAKLRTFTPQTHAQNNAQAEMTVDYTIKVPTI